MGKILLIDDAQFARMVLRTILEEYGYEVCGEAENGIEGVEKYRQMKPDLVFCDVRMNGMDGMECMKEILREDPKAKIVICTAINQQTNTDKILAAGAKAYLEKPVHGEALLRMTEALIGKPKKKSYKVIMEQRAEACGLEKKPLLDFFTAFRSINGFGMDDPRVDEFFLRQNGESLFIGIRAIISAKITLDQMHQLEELFKGLVK